VVAAIGGCDWNVGVGIGASGWGNRGLVWDRWCLWYWHRLPLVPITLVAKGEYMVVVPGWVAWVMMGYVALLLAASGTRPRRLSI